MLSFKKFLQEQELLLCGGNVEIETPDGVASAQKIDLQKIDRTEMVSLLSVGLDLINKAFEKRTGLPLWNDELFKSRKFLSGSAFIFLIYRQSTTKSSLKLNRPSGISIHKFPDQWLLWLKNSLMTLKERNSVH